MNKIFKNNFNLLRLLAAIQVFYFHTTNHLKIDVGIFKYFRNYPGVIIFFTISGYLLFPSIDRNYNDISKYLLNRIGRIYPALFFSTIISIIFILSSYEISNMKSLYAYIFGQLTFFQFWTPDILRNYGTGVPNGSLWTIIVELQFYIVLIFIYSRFNSKIKLLILFLLSIYFNIEIGSMNNSIILKLLKVSLLPYLYNFLIGVIFSKYNILKEKLLNNKFIFWFVLYQILLFFDFNPSYFINIKSLISNIVLSILSLSFAFSLTNYIKSFQLDISYGIYLYHMIFLNIFIEKFGRSLSKTPLYLTSYIFLVILMSLFSYFFIEKPSLHFIKNIKFFNRKVNI